MFFLCVVLNKSVYSEPSQLKFMDIHTHMFNYFLKQKKLIRKETVVMLSKYSTDFGIWGHKRILKRTDQVYLPLFKTIFLSFLLFSISQKNNVKAIKRKKKTQKTHKHINWITAFLKQICLMGWNLNNKTGNSFNANSAFIFCVGSCGLCTFHHFILKIFFY